MTFGVVVKVTSQPHHVGPICIYFGYIDMATAGTMWSSFEDPPGASNTA